MTLWLKFEGYMGSHFMGNHMVLGLEFDCGLRRSCPSPRPAGDSPSKSSSLAIADAFPPPLRGTIVRAGCDE
jgi:hypothetical protein